MPKHVEVKGGGEIQTHKITILITIKHGVLILSKSMVITYVYAKNSALWADRGFLNDVQNTNSNCDITM